MSTMFSNDHDSQTDNARPRKSSANGDRPTSLNPGTLLYLWPPGVTPGDDERVLVRVKTTRQDFIEGIDLWDGSECWYEVGMSSMSRPAQMRWTWQEAAPSQRVSCGDVEIIDAIPDPAERTKFVAGEAGDKLKISMRSGELVHGVLKRMVMAPDNWEAEWAEVEDQVPGGDLHVHVIRVADVQRVTRTRRA